MSVKEKIVVYVTKPYRLIGASVGFATILIHLLNLEFFLKSFVIRNTRKYKDSYTLYRKYMGAVCPKREALKLNNIAQKVFSKVNKRDSVHGNKFSKQAITFVGNNKA